MFSARNKTKTFDISWSALLKIGFALAVGWALYLARDILLLALFALVISFLFNPAINFLEKMKFSRTLAVLAVYLALFGGLGVSIYLVVPVFMIETQQLGQLFPVYFEKVAPVLSEWGFAIFQSMDVFIATIRDWVMDASYSIIGSIAGIFGGVMAMFMLITAAIFFSLEECGMRKFVLLLAPKEHEKSVLVWWERAQVKISGWFAVRLAGMLAVGSFTSLACWALDIRYPVFLGFFAGVADIIPFVGPAVSGAIIAIVALIDSWQKAALAVGIFIVIQQLENNLVIPLLSKKFMEFPAILVLLSLLVGDVLWGLAGAILAIPLFGILYDFVRDYLMKHKQVLSCKT